MLVGFTIVNSVVNRSAVRVTERSPSCRLDPSTAHEHVLRSEQAVSLLLLLLLHFHLLLRHLAVNRIAGGEGGDAE